MKRRNLIAAFLAVLAVASPADQSLLAAGPAVAPTPLPDGPLLNAGGDFSAWQITYSYASDKPSATGKPPPAPTPTPPGNISFLPPRTVTLVRTKPLWHAVAIDIAGGKMDQWCDGSVRFFVENGIPPELPPVGGPFDKKFPNFSAMGFPDLDWISPSTYLGTQTLDTNKCMVFSKGDMKAWIDLKTRFPVRWQQGGETRAFRQLPPPDGMLTLPPDISKISDALKKDAALLHRPVLP